ncbi:MAG: calcium-binding protein [Leptolyngbyaceae cyanobacterium SM1_3_5]|nr:calcium-binding protein [Leptolyngbyaceae cyanobacterium SM1_3_5]
MGLLSNIDLGGLNLGGLNFGGLDFSDVVDVLDGIDLSDITNLFGGIDLPGLGGFDLDDVVDDLAAVADELFDDIDVGNLFDDIRDLDLLNGLGGIFDSIFSDVAEFIGSGDFNDLLDGLTGSPIVRGGRGSDDLIGSSKRDILIGNGGNDTISGLRGDDLIAGGSGRDLIKGLFGNDILSGESGNDTIEGGVGDDLLSGGKGRNTMTGGKGRDTFVLSDDGVDVITDFKVGQDRLGVLSDRDLRDVTFTQQGSNTLVKWDSDTVAILNNVRASQLGRNSIGVVDASSFNFG